MVQNHESMSMKNKKGITVFLNWSTFQFLVELVLKNDFLQCSCNRNVLMSLHTKQSKTLSDFKIILKLAKSSLGIPSCNLHEMNLLHWPFCGCHSPLINKNGLLSAKIRDLNIFSFHYWYDWTGRLVSHWALHKWLAFDASTWNDYVLQI